MKHAPRYFLYVSDNSGEATEPIKGSLLSLTKRIGLLLSDGDKEIKSWTYIHLMQVRMVGIRARCESLIYYSR